MRASYERFIMWLTYVVGQCCERGIEATRDPSSRLKKIKMLAKFYVKNYPGILVSAKLENSLLAIARELPAACGKPLNGRQLHIASELYDIGGHTRVIYNWVLNDSSKPHDLVLLRSSRVPEWLKAAFAESGGRIFDFSYEHDDVLRAMELKTLAAHYDYITLHVHMDDVTPILAFGDSFDRPVRLFNHADQFFWLGASIVDQVFELNSYGCTVTRKYRGLDCSYVLPIVLSEELAHKPVNRGEIRKQLGIPLDKKLLVSMASPSKYRGRGDVFFRQVPEMLNDKTCLVLIGPSKKGEFKKLEQKYPGQVFVVGPKTKDEANDILAAADLYVDSYPVGSFTCMLQAIQVNTPVVTAFPASTPDILLNSKIASLADIRSLDFETLKEQFLIPAQKKISMHYGTGWREILLTAPPVDKHNVRKVEAHAFDPCFYHAWVYFCSNIRLGRIIRRLIKIFVISMFSGHFSILGCWRKVGSTSHSL